MHRVEATATGYYNDILRKPTTVFDLVKAADFSASWMRPVSSSTPATVHRVGRMKRNWAAVPFKTPGVRVHAE